MRSLSRLALSVALLRLAPVEAAPLLPSSSGGSILNSILSGPLSFLNGLEPGSSPSSSSSTSTSNAGTGNNLNTSNATSPTNSTVPKLSDFPDVSSYLNALSGINIYNLSLTNLLPNVGVNNQNNNNPLNPNPPIYPSASPGDAPYSFPESTLRGAIYIPPGFTYGAAPYKGIVILVPGTGVPGGASFGSNFGKLLPQAGYEVVWLNIPNNTLADVQGNAEFAAYAIQYMSSLSQNNTNKVSTLTWSQGAIDVQWAMKYWPSTRSLVQDFVAMSPDFHGTLQTAGACAYPGGCAPSLLQQLYTSNFISVFRGNGGDSAYVPTTTVYSTTDESVQPQTGGPLASAYLFDSRNVGVTNNEIQVACLLRPAGGVTSHAGVLHNPLAYALAIDALNNDGPGQLSRLDLNTVCGQSVTPGLGPDDVVATEAATLINTVNYIVYDPKTSTEPPIKAYAAQ